ncbi:hypothetical protein [Streptomyces sp. NPDC056491]|uniref:hypothetical protein n=1 Tax=Streptomyces sp. NPDC056491 TaxID=3345837 RepID=UPI0036C951C9
MNHALHRAMANAKMTEAHLADACGVDPYRSAAPASLWKSLVTKTQRELVFAGYTNYFLWLEQANLASALRRKAAEDVPLTLSTRIAVTLSELEKLGDVSGIEGRFETGHVNLSVFRFDDEMIVTPILARRVGHDSPMMHLRRRQADGMFDRFAAHVEELWSRGRDIREAKQHDPT